jgi:hypothetical protein
LLALRYCFGVTAHPITSADQRTERTPREEAFVQAISLAAMLVLVTVGPMIERAMTDPDVSFRLRWHLRNFRHKWERAVHEANITLETAIGLWQIEESLRKRWKGTNVDA